MWFGVCNKNYFPLGLFVIMLYYTTKRTKVLRQYDKGDSG